MKIGIKRIIIIVIISGAFFLFLDLVNVFSGKHSINIDRANECFWIFKEKNKVDNEYKVAFVGRKDVFYKYQYADSLRICIWKFNNINKIRQITTDKNINDCFTDEDNLESYDFDSFILKSKLRFKMGNSICLDISLKKSKPVLYLKGCNFTGVISFFNQISVSDIEPKACLCFTKNKPFLLLIYKNKDDIYVIIVEGKKNVKVNRSVMNIFSFTNLKSCKKQ
jgi:hypothetical protein